MASLTVCLKRLAKEGASERDLAFLRGATEDFRQAGHADAPMRAAQEWQGVLTEERAAVLEEIRAAARAAGKDPERFVELRQATKEVVASEGAGGETQAPAPPREGALPGIAPRDEGAQALRDAELARAVKAEEAPGPEGFTLTGSDRPADELAARGQGGLFGRSGGTVPRRTPGGAAAEAARRPDEIIHDLSKALDVPIRYGHVRRRTWLGHYQSGAQVIRRRGWNDLETVAHEVGHMLDERLPGLRAAMTTHKGEIKPLASPGQDKLAEGFAKWMRLWLSQRPEAVRRAPKFAAAFEGLLEGHPQISKVLDAATGDIDRWFRLPPEARLASKIGARPRTLGERTEGAGRRAVFKLLDQYDPIKRAVGELSGGQKLPAGEDPYALTRLAAGSDGEIDHFVRRGTLPFDLHARAAVAGSAGHGKPLAEVLRPVAGDPDGFERYMVARRAEELLGQGRERLFTKEEVDGTLKRYESPEFRAAFDGLQEWQDAVLQYARDGGLVSPELYAQIKAGNLAYVPFRRVLEREAPRSARGTAANPIQSLKGASLNIQDPLQSILDNAALLITATNRNHAVATLAKLAGSTTGGGKWMKRLPKVPEALRVQGRQVVEDLARTLETTPDDLVQLLGDGDAGQMAALKAQLDDFVGSLRTYWRQTPKASKTRYELVARIDGEPVAFAVEPELYDALMHMAPDEMNVVEKALAGFGRTLRAGVVFEPSYMLRNISRDTLTAWVQSRHGFVPVLDSVRGAVQAATRDADYWRYLAFGGGQSSFWTANEEATRRFASRLFERRPQRTGRFQWGVIDNARKARDLIEYLGEVTESGSRLGEFARAQGDAAVPGGPGDRMAAAALAGREVSTDFAMRGASRSLHFMTRITPFLNAGIQGLYRGFRAATEDGFKQSFLPVAVKGGGIMAASLGLYLAQRDEEWFKDLPEWERNMYWHLGPLEEGGPVVRVAKPFEFGFLFGTAPIRALEAWESGLREREGEKFAQAAMQAFGLRVVPPSLAVPIELTTNTNLFTGHPIVSPFAADAPYDYDAWTLQSTRAIAEQFGVSAPKLEQAVRGMTGSLGMLVLEGADAAMRMANPAIPARPERTLADYPGTKAFFSRNPQYSSGPVTELYDLYEEMAGKVRTLRKLQEENNQPGCDGCRDAAIERLSQQFAEQGGTEAFGAAKGAQKFLGARRKEMLGIMDDRQMDSKAKRQAMDVLIRERNARAREGVEEVLGLRQGAR